MNSPREMRKVRLRGLGGQPACGVRSTCASATARLRAGALRPGDLVNAGAVVQQPRTDKEEVREAVEVGEHVGAHLFLVRQADDGALRGAADGAGQMRARGRLVPAGK